jgi:hypothetical protein
MVQKSAISTWRALPPQERELEILSRSCRLASHRKDNYY